MLEPKYCFLLSQVAVVQKPCTKPVVLVQPVVEDKPITMDEAFNTFTPLTYVSNKFN